LTITTFLLDLDDTLLGNPMSKFLPAYFAGLEKYLQKYAGNKTIRKIMAASVQALQANQDPRASNMDLFMADFSDRLGVSADELRSVLQLYYRQEYPHLQQYTTHRPEAAQIVKLLLSAGYEVIIATNPLFPETAIRQRMAWAGVDGFAYALVTTMENSHYSKPNPRYYQEILDKTKSVPQTTLMVDDDPENDITPAGSLGLKTWWITHNAAHQAETATPSDYRGSLADFLEWVVNL